MQERFRQFLIWLIDTVFDCSFEPEIAYYWENGRYWRFSVNRCWRCGKVDSMLTLPADFWDAERPTSQFTLSSDW